MSSMIYLFIDMDFQEFFAGEQDNDRRLDRILRKFLCEEALSNLYKSLRKGLIKVNDKKATPNLKIQTGDKISIPQFLLNQQNFQNKKNSEKKATTNSNNKICYDYSLIEKNIIFKNEHIIALNKPYGINVQSSAKDDISLNSLIQNEYLSSDKSSENLSFKPGALHRLDKNTTGVLIFSQSLAGAKWFSAILQSHKTKKIYLGILEGKLLQKQIWNANIQKSKTKKNNFKTVEVDNSKDSSGKSSTTIVTPLKYGIFNEKQITLAKFEIPTGRTHQIRSVSAFYNFPLLGDCAYGAQKQNLNVEYFLHSYKLILTKNELNIPIEFKAELPKAFVNFLKASLINFNGEL